MQSTDRAILRVAMPLFAAILGALLFALSPVSHKAFCTPLTIPVILSPEVAAPTVPVS